VLRHELLGQCIIRGTFQTSDVEHMNIRYAGGMRRRIADKPKNVTLAVYLSNVTKRRDTSEEATSGSVMRSTHGNREFADLSLLLYSIRNHHFDSLREVEVRVSGSTCACAYTNVGSVTSMNNAGEKYNRPLLPNFDM
jgi:hypothetical protein